MQLKNKWMAIAITAGFCQFGWAQLDNTVDTQKFVRVQKIGAGQYRFETFASYSVVNGVAATTSVDVATQGNEIRGFTSNGDEWFTVEMKGSDQCFQRYDSYPDLVARTATKITCNPAGKELVRGLTYDGAYFRALKWDGQAHLWQSFKTWSDVVNNLPAASHKTLFRNSDMYTAIGFNPVDKSYYSYVNYAGRELHMFKYESYIDLMTAKNIPTLGISKYNNSLVYSGLAMGPTAKKINMYLVAGQSNAVGYRSEGGKLKDLDGGFAGYSNIPFFYRIGEGLNTDVRSSSAVTILRPQAMHARYRNVPIDPTTFGIEMGSAKTLYEGGAKNMAVVKVAFSGTNLAEQWNPSNPIGLTNVLLTQLSEASTQWNKLGFRTKLAGVFWMQGEYDGQNPDYARAYKTNLTNFLATLRTDAGNAQLPVVIGKIIIPGYWGTYGQVVRDAQEAVVAADPFTRLANADDLTRYVYPEGDTDPGHLNSAGSYKLGTRMGVAMLPLLGLDK